MSLKTLFLQVVALACFAQFALSAVITVNQQGFAFSPATVTIRAGDSVKFVFESTQHNAAQSADADTNVPFITSGVSTVPRPPKGIAGGFRADFGVETTVLFTAPGTYFYLCQPHAFFSMKGSIIVLAAPLPTVKPSIKPTLKPSPKPSLKPSPKPSLKPSPKPSLKPSPKPIIAVVTQSGRAFFPAQTTIRVGSSVQFVFTSPASHNVAQSASAASIFPLVSSGVSVVPRIPGAATGGFRGEYGTTAFTVKFTAPGTYFFLCEPHAAVGMKGSIVVTL
eukprot:CAMPEP_0184674376 /NCGR_PEP_ID=MMETSP0308-20130426/87202_1 /TAXON_ID=38269 /ORGANISM="Gloeochaete witrockiana, Strain SAG 46.84" /LENGTH=278 /DNA_ID=CAMNT_0027121969 /DNA_START=105 /DNA_END=941 /DNA_ORIENTATION=-